jgi:hypothetical protein
VDNADIGGSSGSRIAPVEDFYEAGTSKPTSIAGYNDSSPSEQLKSLHSSSFGGITREKTADDHATTIDFDAIAGDIPASPRPDFPRARRSSDVAQ